ncbi:hypothetical protein Z043_111476 [Scleropages formosus]|uniref:Uncharacterized protein n=1 Tax=Scleropages formosus TaxID=113540 RepID=A0A0P7UIN0_SCLFO|nr:uncharacterized protein LOC108923238 [Scleropages formosus]KPP69750.1 hypothetical protein Z043_111476 [Scleropages formosus]
MASRQDGTQQQSACPKALDVKRKEALDAFELYVPEEAEVRTVPVKMLPLSVLKRMGRLAALGKKNGLTEGDGSLTATWISPVVVRERSAPHGCGDNSAAKDRLSKLAMVSATQLFHYWLPITCSNLVAFKVLKQFLPSGHDQQNDPEKEMMQKASQVPPLHQGGPLTFTQDSIIILSGQSFLFIKKLRQAMSSRNCRQSSASCIGTLTAAERLELGSGPSCPRCGRSSSVVKGLDAESQDISEQQRFSITQNVHVALKRIAATDVGKDSGAAPVNPCSSSENQDGQMSPSIGTSTEQHSSSVAEEDASDGQALQGSEQVQVLDSGEPLEEDIGEEDLAEPALKKARLTVPSDFLSNCAELLDEGSGVCEEDGSKCEHQTRDGDTGVQGGAAAPTVENEEQQNTCGSWSEGEGQANAGDQSSHVSSYFSSSALEDTVAFDFEQLAREERINRIRERLREKEAALRRMEPLS